MSLSLTGRAAGRRPQPSSSSNASPNEKRKDLLTAEEALNLMESKMSSRYRSVREAFIRMDSDVDGFIGPDELRIAMDQMGLTLTGREFRRFWKLFDTSGDDKVDFLEFNNKVGTMIKPMNMGLNLNRPETPQLKDWQKKSMATRVRKQVQDIQETFRVFDTDGSGLISQPEFINAMRQMGVRGIGDTESWQFMQRYRKPQNDSGQMTFDEFQECMMDLLKLGSAREREDADTDNLLQCLEALENLIEQKIPRDILRMKQALVPYDTDRLGDLTHDQLRKALCGITGLPSLTEKQMKVIIDKYDRLHEGSVGVNEFSKQWATSSFKSGIGGGIHTGHFSTSFGAEKFWPTFGIRPIRDPITGQRIEPKKLPKVVAPKLGFTEAEAGLALGLLGRFPEARKVILDADKEFTGELNRNQFRSVIEKLNLVFSDDALASITPRFDRMKNGKINIEEFLKMYQKYTVLTDINLTLLGLERIPANELVTVNTSLGNNTVGSSSSSSAAAASITTTTGGTPSNPQNSSSHRSSPTKTISSPLNKATVHTLQHRSSPTAAASSSPSSSSSSPLRSSVFSQMGKHITGSSSGSPLSPTKPFPSQSGRTNTNLLRDEDSMSVTTQTVDVLSTARRMVKIIGNRWSQVFSDIRKKAEREAVKKATSSQALPNKSMMNGSSLWSTTQGTGGMNVSTAIQSSNQVNIELFRDVLATYNVALTSTEVHALALRYGGGGNNSSFQQSRGIHTPKSFVTNGINYTGSSNIDYATVTIDIDQLNKDVTNLI